MSVGETLDARKQRFGPDDLPSLFGDARRVLIGKGKSFVAFDLEADDLDVEALKKAALGPSGNLRAPAARVGKTWLIGFTPDSWAEVLG